MNYIVPANISLGKYSVVVGLWNSQWDTLKYETIGSIDIVASSLSSACNFPNWVSSQRYAVGSIVKYSNGKFYRAKLRNRGQVPSTSPYYWAEHACQ